MVWTRETGWVNKVSLDEFGKNMGIFWSNWLYVIDCNFMFVIYRLEQWRAHTTSKTPRYPAISPWDFCDMTNGIHWTQLHTLIVDHWCPFDYQSLPIDQIVADSLVVGIPPLACCLPPCVGNIRNVRIVNHSSQPSNHTSCVWTNMSVEIKKPLLSWIGTLTYTHISAHTHTKTYVRVKCLNNSYYIIAILYAIWIISITYS